MRHVGTLALIASSAAAAGGAAWFARERLSHVRTGTCANPAIHAGSADEAGRIVRHAERFRRLWPEVTGDAEMPRAALEIALAQGLLESGLAEAGGGGWWKDKTSAGGGDMRGSGNIGARQCGANDTGGDYYTCVEYGDSQPNADGTQTFFPAKFRYYKAGTVGGKQRDAADAAAYEFLRDITHQWPALAELRSGDVLAYAMRQGPKYRSGDPPNQKVFGREYKGGNGYYGGFGATMQERVGGYVRAIASHLPAIAAALGQNRIYACIPPEAAAGGPVHAAVSGLEGVYSALHSVGALPRARAIPGSNGAAIVWYVQQTQVVSGAASEDTMKTQEIVKILNSGAPLPAPPTVEGVGTTALIAVAAATTAAVVGAEMEHLLKKKEKAKEKAAEEQKKPQVDTRKGAPAHRPPVITLHKDPAPAREAVTLPALDEDRGSLAALQPLISLPSAPAVAPSPVTLQRPTSAPVALPALDQDRGSVAAIQSSKLTRDDMRQMFPTYTETQIDDALKQLNGVESAPLGMSSDMRADLARLASLEARDATSSDDREHLRAIAESLSGEEQVTPESAAASDAYLTARHANVEGAGKVVAIAAGALAATGVAAGALYEREHRLAGERVDLLRGILRKNGLDVVPSGPVPAGYEMAMGSYSMEPDFAKAMTDYRTALNPLDRLMPSGDPDKVLGWMMAHDTMQLVRKKGGAKVEGVGVAIAVTAAGLAAGVGFAALLSKVTSPAAPPAPPPVPSAPSPAPRAPAGPPPKTDLRRAQDELAALYTRMAPASEIEAKQRQIAALQAPKGAPPSKAPAPAPAAPAAPPEEPGITSALSSLLSSDDDTVTVSRNPPPTHGIAATHAALAMALRVPSPDIGQVRAIVEDMRRAESPTIGSVLPTLITEASKTARVYTVYQTVTGAAALLVVGLLVWGAVKSGAFSKGAEKPADRADRLQKLQGALSLAMLQNPRDASVISGIAKQIVDLGEESGELPLCSDIERAIAMTRIGSLGANKPDDIDNALATGSDVADAASGLMQAFAAGKKIAERGIVKEDPKCRKTVKAYVDNHPILSQVLRLTQAGRDVRSLAGVNIGDADIETFKNRYVDEVLRQRAAAGKSGDDCEVTPEEDRAALLNLGARPSDFQVFTESLSHWAPDKVLPAAAAAFRTAAPAAKGVIPGAQSLSDLSSLLPQQREAMVTPQREAAPPQAVEKGMGAGTVAVIAAGAAAAAAIIVAIVTKK